MPFWTCFFQIRYRDGRLAKGSFYVGFLPFFTAADVNNSLEFRTSKFLALGNTEATEFHQHVLSYHLNLQIHLL